MPTLPANATRTLKPFGRFPDRRDITFVALDTPFSRLDTTDPATEIYGEGSPTTSRQDAVRSQQPDGTWELFPANVIPSFWAVEFPLDLHISPGFDVLIPVSSTLGNAVGKRSTLSPEVPLFIQDEKHSEYTTARYGDANGVVARSVRSAYHPSISSQDDMFSPVKVAVWCGFLFESQIENTIPSSDMLTDTNSDGIPDDFATDPPTHNGSESLSLIAAPDFEAGVAQRWLVQASGMSQGGSMSTLKMAAPDAFNVTENFIFSFYLKFREGFSSVTGVDVIFSFFDSADVLLGTQTVPLSGLVREKKRYEVRRSVSDYPANTAKYTVALRVNIDGTQLFVSFLTWAWMGNNELLVEEVGYASSIILTTDTTDVLVRTPSFQMDRVGNIDEGDFTVYGEFVPFYSSLDLTEGRRYFIVTPSRFDEADRFRFFYDPTTGGRFTLSRDLNNTVLDAVSIEVSSLPGGSFSRFQRIRWAFAHKDNEKSRVYVNGVEKVSTTSHGGFDYTGVMSGTLNLGFDGTGGIERPGGGLGPVVGYGRSLPSELLKKLTKS